MSFKLSTPLSGLVYFGFFYSFAQSSFLQEEYVSQVWSVGLNEQVNPICDVPLQKWAGICTYYIGEIRKRYEIYHEMRINYMAFSINEEKCQKNILQFMYPLPDGTFHAKQNMMLCFGREAIVPVRKSYEEYKYYMEIAIYPKDENTMMVFHYSYVDHSFILFEKYERKYWPAIPDITHPSLLITPPPHVISEENDVYNRLHEIVDLLKNTSKDRSNVLYAVNENEYEELLIMLVKYSYLSNTAFKRRDDYCAETVSKGVVLRNSLVSSVRETNLNTISCVLWSKIQERTKIYSMRLSAGPENHSVLLLSRTKCKKKHVYRIMNIFENLHPEFISYYL